MPLLSPPMPTGQRDSRLPDFSDPSFFSPSHAGSPVSTPQPGACDLSSFALGSWPTSPGMMGPGHRPMPRGPRHSSPCLHGHPNSSRSKASFSLFGDSRPSWPRGCVDKSFWKRGEPLEPQSPQPAPRGAWPSSVLGLSAWSISAP